MRARLALVLLLLPLLPQRAPATPLPADRPGRSKPVYSRSVTETHRVRMRDGETLWVQIERPVTPRNVKVPVILTLSPYNALREPRVDDPSTADARLTSDAVAKFFVPRGYARATADVRGIRESSGCWDYGGVKERRDGYDLVEWLARRSWSNGRIGMFGGSYDGATAVMTAAERPPHLAAIVPFGAVTRWYDYAYHNGVRWLLNSERPTDEGADTPAAFDFGLAVPPPIGVSGGEHYTDAVSDRYTPCDRVAHTQRGYSPRPDYDAFWRERDYTLAASKVRVPALIAHGLDDYNVKAAGSVALWRAYRGPKRLVLGQWAHELPRAVASGSWQNLLWRWFDQWLLRLDTGVMREPPAHSQDSLGRWRVSTTWPPPATSAARLIPAKATPGETDPTWLDDPTLTEERMMAEPLDPTFVRFETSPFPRAVRITGEIKVTLKLESSARTTHIVVLAAQVDPDNHWQRISRGLFDPRYRRSLARAEDLHVGEPYTISFTLQPADHIIPSGHRLAIVVASSDVHWAVPAPLRSINTVFVDGKSSVFQLPIAR